MPAGEGGHEPLRTLHPPPSVATTLLTIGLLLAGLFAYVRLPVAPLPQVDFPVILVQAQMAGASPETMATTVAAPLERRLGVIADVNEMTSTSSQGSVRIILLFGLNRDIDGAAGTCGGDQRRAGDLPTSLRTTRPTASSTRRFADPDPGADLGHAHARAALRFRRRATIVQQRMSQIEGVGNVDIGGSSLPAVRVELDPTALFHYGIGLEGIRAGLASANANSPKGDIVAGGSPLPALRQRSGPAGQRLPRHRRGLSQRRGGAPVRCRRGGRFRRGQAQSRPRRRQAGVILFIYKQPGSNVVETVARVRAAIPQVKAALPAISTSTSPATAPPRSAPRSPPPRRRCSSRSSSWCS